MIFFISIFSFPSGDMAIFFKFQTEIFISKMKILKIFILNFKNEKFNFFISNLMAHFNFFIFVWWYGQNSIQISKLIFFNFFHFPLVVVWPFFFKI
jgi:hypothetical protein